MRLKDKFSHDFFLVDNALQIKPANVDELMLLWAGLANEPQERVTCRPVRHRTDEEQKAFYSELLLDDSICFFTLTVKGLPAGRISLSDFNPRNASVELGYSLLPDYRGRHYMKSALDLLLDDLFCRAQINKVYAQTAAFNTSSLKMLASLSFHCDACLRQHHEWDGVLYDDYIYSILAQDYFRSKGY